MTTLVELIAIVVGPIVAVLITLWHQDRQRSYERKLSVLEGLVLWRSDINRVEWVTAFNLLPIHFRNHPKVIEKRKALYQHLSTSDWEGVSENALNRLLDQVAVMNAQLVKAVADSIRVKVPELDLIEAAIAPTRDSREVEAARTRQATLSILEGATALNVVVWRAPVPPKEHLQQEAP